METDIMLDTFIPASIFCGCRRGNATIHPNQRTVPIEN
jgi:hypothetical protein